MQAIDSLHAPRELPRRVDLQPIFRGDTREGNCQLKAEEANANMANQPGKGFAVQADGRGNIAGAEQPVAKGFRHQCERQIGEGDE